MRKRVFRKGFAFLMALALIAGFVTMPSATAEAAGKVKVRKVQIKMKKGRPGKSLL